MSISLKSGKPIAKIINKGSKNHNKLIYLREIASQVPEQQVKNKLDKLENSFFSKHKLKAIEIQMIRKAILDNVPPTDEKLNNIYCKALRKIDKKILTELTLKGGKLQPLPINKEGGIFECLYVSGPSGSGKSHFASNWIKEYKKQFKDNDFYIFSSVDEDKPLDKLKPIRIDIDADLIEDPLEPDEIENSVVLFDDTDTIMNKYLKIWVANFRDSLLQTGRHHNIKLVVTTHVLLNYKATQNVINEATHIVFFPRGGSTYQIKRLLKEYIGIDKAMSKRILSLPSRWILISKLYPMYCMYEKGVFLLGQQDDED